VPQHQGRWYTFQHADNNLAARDEYECRTRHTYMPAPFMLYGPMGNGVMGVPVQGEPQVEWGGYSQCMQMKGYVYQ
jgi:hypothetical protein